MDIDFQQIGELVVPNWVFEELPDYVEKCIPEVSERTLIEEYSALNAVERLLMDWVMNPYRTKISFAKMGILTEGIPRSVYFLGAKAQMVIDFLSTMEDFIEMRLLYIAGRMGERVARDENGMVIIPSLEPEDCPY